MQRRLLQTTRQCFFFSLFPSRSIGPEGESRVIKIFCIFAQYSLWIVIVMCGWAALWPNSEIISQFSAAYCAGARRTCSVDTLRDHSTGGSGEREERTHSGWLRCVRETPRNPYLSRARFVAAACGMPHAIKTCCKVFAAISHCSRSQSERARDVQRLRKLTRKATNINIDQHGS